MTGDTGMDHFGRFTGSAAFRDGSSIRDASPTFVPLANAKALKKSPGYVEKLKLVKTGKYISENCFAREKIAGTDQSRPIVCWVAIDDIAPHYCMFDQTHGRPLSLKVPPRKMFLGTTVI